jgi:hypothetical protein
LAANIAEPQARDFGERRGRAKSHRSVPRPAARGGGSAPCAHFARHPHRLAGIPGDTPYESGAEGDRTPDLIHAMDALSQLSYGPWTFPSPLGGAGALLYCEARHMSRFFLRSLQKLKILAFPQPEPPEPTGREARDARDRP